VSGVLSRQRRHWSLAILLIFAAAVAAFVANTKENAAELLVAHTHEVRTAIRGLAADLNELESQRRGYAITGDVAFVERHDDVRAAARAGLGRVRALTTDSPTQQARLDGLDRLVGEALDYDARLITLLDSGQREAVFAAIKEGSGRRMMVDVRGNLDAMEAEETGQLAGRLRHVTRMRLVANVALAAAAASALLVTGFAIAAALREGRAKLRAAAALAENEARFRRLAEASFEGIVVSESGTIRDVNAAYCELVGWPADALVGRSLLDFVADDERARVEAKIGAGYEEKYETALVHRDGRRILIEVRARMVGCEGRTIRLTALRDITARRRADEALARHHEKLRTLSTSDELTGLHNRRGFHETVATALAEANRRREPAGLIFCDLNGLKAINDELGHETGDQAIQDTAGILRAVTRGRDVIGRLGGDEFVVYVEGGGLDIVEAVARRIEQRTAAFNETAGRRYRLSMSVGFATTHGRARTLAELLAEADTMMYQQKRSQRSLVSGPRLAAR
jgi:diguanylate cyclase (GGDEF)-like protein/PAS domain S-box-containing protein